MAFRSIRISDLTGKEAKEDEFYSLIVRSYPGLEEPVVLDALQAELKGLKAAEGLVEVEIKNGGEPQRLIVQLEEFNKLAPDIAGIIAKADGIRGRRKGFRPSAVE